MLGNTIKSQLVNVKTFLEDHGVDTRFFDLSAFTPAPSGASTTSAPAASTPHGLPSASAIALRRQHRLGMFDFRRRRKILPNQTAPGGEILRAPEIDGVIFQCLPFRHQPVA